MYTKLPSGFIVDYQNYYMHIYKHKYESIKVCKNTELEA